MLNIHDKKPRKCAVVDVAGNIYTGYVRLDSNSNTAYVYEGFQRKQEADHLPEAMQWRGTGLTAMVPQPAAIQTDPK